MTVYNYQYLSSCTPQMSELYINDSSIKRLLKSELNTRTDFIRVKEVGPKAQF